MFLVDRLAYHWFAYHLASWLYSFLSIWIQKYIYISKTTKKSGSQLSSKKELWPSCSLVAYSSTLLAAWGFGLVQSFDRAAVSDSPGTGSVSLGGRHTGDQGGSHWLIYTRPDQDLESSKSGSRVFSIWIWIWSLLENLASWLQGKDSQFIKNLTGGTKRPLMKFFLPFLCEKFLCRAVVGARTVFNQGATANIPLGFSRRENRFNNSEPILLQSFWCEINLVEFNFVSCQLGEGGRRLQHQSASKLHCNRVGRLSKLSSSFIELKIRHTEVVSSIAAHPWILSIRESFIRQPITPADGTMPARPT